jgi:acetyl-CoA acyltransferase 1
VHGQAIANIAAAIRTGSIDVGIGAGVESMSQRNMTEVQPQASTTWTLWPQAQRLAAHG